MFYVCDKDPSNIIKENTYVNKMDKYYSRVQICQI